jgi:hypothetical protein
MKGKFVICATQQIHHDSGDENKGNEGAGQVTRTGKKRNANRILVSKSEGMNHWKDLGMDRRIILK